MRKIVFIVSLCLIVIFSFVGCTSAFEPNEREMIGWSVVEKGTAEIKISVFDNKSFQAEYYITETEYYLSSYPPSSRHYSIRLKDIPYDIEIWSNPKKINRVVIENREKKYEWFADNEPYEGSCQFIQFASSVSRPEEFCKTNLSDKIKLHLLEAGESISQQLDRQ